MPLHIIAGIVLIIVALFVMARISAHIKRIEAQERAEQARDHKRWIASHTLPVVEATRQQDRAGWDWTK